VDPSGFAGEPLSIELAEMVIYGDAPSQPTPESAWSSFSSAAYGVQVVPLTPPPGTGQADYASLAHGDWARSIENDPRWQGAGWFWAGVSSGRTPTRGGTVIGARVPPEAFPIVGEFYTGFLDPRATEQAQIDARIMLVWSLGTALVGGAITGTATGAGTRAGGALLPGAGTTGAGGLRVASSGLGAVDANIVRTIRYGEKVADIVAEVKGLTFSTGMEHAVVSLRTGERVLVSGGPGGIDLSALSVRRILGHSHPYHLPPTGPSAADFAALQQLGQRSSYILEHGALFRYSAP
jgi:hypothetical protein